MNEFIQNVNEIRKAAYEKEAAQEQTNKEAAVWINETTQAIKDFIVETLKEQPKRVVFSKVLRYNPAMEQLVTALASEGIDAEVVHDSYFNGTIIIEFEIQPYVHKD